MGTVAAFLVGVLVGGVIVALVYRNNEKRLREEIDGLKAKVGDLMGRVLR